MLYLENIGNDAIKLLKPSQKKKLKNIEHLKGKSDYELVDYVHSIIKDLPIFHACSTPYNKKSNVKCDEFRKEADACGSNWQRGLQLLSKSIAYAEPGSESLVLSYSNRSQMLLDKGFYNESMQDIDRAFKCDCSEDLQQILSQRRQNSDEFKRHFRLVDYHDTIPVVNYRNKLIGSGSDAIAIATNEKWGQHIIAARDIRIGEVLAVETPYVGQVNTQNEHLHCHECMELCYNLIACENCTEVMYCDEECKEKAYKTYHKYECILLQHGLKNKRAFLKLTLKAILDYDRFTNDLSRKDDPKYQSNRYKEVYQMDTRKNSKTPMELFQLTLEPVVFYHYLTKYTNILQKLKVKQKDKVLKELLLRNNLLTWNKINIEKMKRDYSNPSRFQQVGYGIFPLYNKFRHSCFPNSALIFYGSKAVIRAYTNIKKGDHITTTYGVTFFGCPKSERQAHLQKFNYVCQCTACLEDWPMKGQLAKGTQIPEALEAKILDNFNNWLFARSGINKLLADAFTFHNSLKPTEVPTENYILLRCLISDLYVTHGNVIEN